MKNNAASKAMAMAPTIQNSRRVITSGVHCTPAQTNVCNGAAQITGTGPIELLPKSRFGNAAAVDRSMFERGRPTPKTSTSGCVILMPASLNITGMKDAMVTVVQIKK